MSLRSDLEMTWLQDKNTHCGGDKMKIITYWAREISESDWFTCTHSEYQYYKASREHDTKETTKQK
jgi:hypothetical protein